jgi:hypothetical protein
MALRTSGRRAVEQQPVDAVLARGHHEAVEGDRIVNVTVHSDVVDLNDVRCSMQDVSTTTGMVLVTG